MTRALKAVGVHAELHVYDGGGHGFGLRKSEFPVHTWPARAGEWLARAGISQGSRFQRSRSKAASRSQAFPCRKAKCCSMRRAASPIELEIKGGAYAALVPAGEFTVTIEGKGVPEKYSAAAASPLKVSVAAQRATEVRFDLK